MDAAFEEVEGVVMFDNAGIMRGNVAAVWEGVYCCLWEVGGLVYLVFDWLFGRSGA